MTDIKEIIDLMRNPTKEDKALVEKAYKFAEQAHADQRRFSGEPYIIHPFETAKILADFKADAETIAAGLLHDTVEDTNITTENIEKEFGENVAFMVEGVTKLGELKYHGVERHVESLRKLFLSMAQDIRVIIIRLADRLHNVRTLQYVRPEKQKRIAVETLEIYAPLANRLGIWRLKGMLEDAAFPYALPEAYKQVVSLRKTKGKETIKRLEKIYRSLSKTLAERGVKNAIIDYRIKYLYSLYAKLLRKNMDIGEIYDISALRIIVDTLEECYQVLGIVHSMFKPVPGRMKDYIANPKPNGYQSIHTSVFTGDGNIVEIQIRSKQMHYEAEYGVASHIYYEELKRSNKQAPNAKEVANMDWVQDLIKWQEETGTSGDFMKALKVDFLSDRIFVFTPKGDVVELPKGSTPVDFAYAIHSDIGDHAAAARINNKFVSLDTKLQNNDVVLIEVKRTSHPTLKWLDHVKTPAARKHIQTYLNPPESALSKLIRWGRK